MNATTAAKAAGQTAIAAELPVKVYLNTTTDWAGRHVGMVDGFDPAHTFELAISYSQDVAGYFDGPVAVVKWVAERAFETFNIGDDMLAQEYRANGHRSLSVGDLVLVGESCLAVGRFGWDIVALPASLA